MRGEHLFLSLGTIARDGIIPACAGSTRGCRIMRGGREFSVVGDPQPPTAGNVPGPWDRTVETEACDG